MPGPRVALYALVAVLVLAVGGFAAYDFFDGRSERQAEEQMLKYAAASESALPLVKDYALPSSIDAHATCAGFIFRCGSSDLEPRAAAAAAAAGFVPKGLALGETDCDPNSTPSDAACSVELKYAGLPVGAVHASRDDVPFRIFGEPTRVTVSMNTTGDAMYGGTMTDVVALPAADLAEAFATLDADGARAFDCTEKSKTGCLSHLAKTSSSSSRQATWTETGRALVRDGWRDVTGRCDPAAPKSPCTINATWYLQADRQLSASVRVSTEGSGARVRIEAQPWATVVTNANGVPVGTS